MLHKNAQIWVETVLYTLIGLALIAAVLVFVTPKITETKDKLLIDQSIESLKVFDSKLESIISKGSGNIGKITNFNLKKGSLYFNSSNDSIILILDNLKTLYSEPNVAIYNGRVKIISTQGQNYNSVSLSLSFPLNTTYAGQDEEKKFTVSPTPYSFTIENINNKYIDINEVSGR